MKSQNSQIREDDAAFHSEYLYRFRFLFLFLFPFLFLVLVLVLHVACLAAMMNRRSDWMRLTSVLKPGRNRLQPNLPFFPTIRSTSTKRRLIDSAVHSPLSSPWTTTRVVLLSFFTGSITYLYGSSTSRSPPVDRSPTADDQFPKYATPNDFAKAGCDCELPRSFRSLMHHVVGNCGAASTLIQGCLKHR